MENNNIIAAPQVRTVDDLFTEWKKSHTGGKSAFYDFLTSPTLERDEFVAQFMPVISFSGSILNAVVNLQNDDN